MKIHLKTVNKKEVNFYAFNEQYNAIYNNNRLHTTWEVNKIHIKLWIMQLNFLLNVTNGGNACGLV